MEKKLAWLNDPDLKEQVLLRMKEHRAEDSIVQGYYQQYAPELATQFRGCLLGCTLPKRVSTSRREGQSTWGWHVQVADLYGIPQRVAYLLENIFENLPIEHCADFAVDSIEAIPVGADLSALGDYYESRSIVNEAGECTCSACLSDPGPLLEERDYVLSLLRNAPVLEPAQ